MELKFFKCKKCGQIVAIIKNSGAKLVCCNEEMTEIIPSSVDASKEKHVPVIDVIGDLVNVSVGSVNHPMLEEHYIEWILLRTNFGNQRKTLKPNDLPMASFKLLDGEEVIEAYAYCNLHGLWRSN